MTRISKKENEIINADFPTASTHDLLLIKQLISDIKKHKGLYQDVIKHGGNIYNSKNCITEKTGLSEKISGHLAMILWFIAKPELEIASRLKIGISESVWVFEEFLCKHPDHRSLNGKRYLIRKGMRIGFFRHIHPGQLVGCGCIARAIIPMLDKKPA
ncbi:hypothetical protein ACOGYG_001390 [Edwardsiella piscicida]|uniref:hypothetical protein n=1 Tax=Edwardsiella piscicida TaxID=1263550 RepID=UPI0002C04825|nr:hypothetical protein [Edwardsiella piscicida]AGH74709.1 hypothetical protein ETAC_12940 [Edwardsiella piscicida C07-087]EKS7779518.1 hypothetical protein [Edwardsiella piscicida]EKS7782939.1 hypothetical protein [Edwardsiella piscicida]UCQ21858.1 hypothetical protein DCE66_03930 [Edwardsiella piscicida]UCQ33874.1 hypothetical protein DCF34_12950 [Edwardsiella piscicida]